jgi:hypothetical protein
VEAIASNVLRGEAHVLFLFLICHDDALDAPDSMGSDTVAWVEEVEVRGTRLAGGRVEPPAMATIVRVRDGERIVRPGPRTDEPEYVAGFDVLEFDTDEEAIEAAALHPMAAHGVIEVRPMRPDDSSVQPAG